MLLESDMETIQPVILCGGRGTRLWPMSRGQFPKQFLALTEQRETLLQQTVQRTAFLSQPSIMVCNQSHRFIVAEQCRSIDYQPAKVILEPCCRNTAPAVAIAALLAQQQGEDPLLLVMASDHVIEDNDSFELAVAQAAQLASEGFLVTFGVEPDSPQTGYGYICVGETIGGGNRIEHFFEKPSRDLAEEYIRSGCYLWNSGMFLFRASVYLEELRQHNLHMLEVCEQVMANSQCNLGVVSLDETSFEQCPDEAVDTAVMEKTDRAVVCPLTAGWADVGTWGGLWDISEKDNDGNVLGGDVINASSHNCLVKSNSRLVTLVGVEDLVVIETVDAILVANKQSMQEVKNLTKELENTKRYEHDLHREVFRPWGKYDSIDRGQRFQVKHITVKPGESLSLQMHHHRAEHWIVVSGTAAVVRGDDQLLLTENESVYIPIGTTHRLSNPGKVVLELIEVQSGAYLGEDDIVRFEDIYERVASA